MSKGQGKKQAVLAAVTRRRGGASRRGSRLWHFRIVTLLRSLFPFHLAAACPLSGAASRVVDRRRPVVRLAEPGSSNRADRAGWPIERVAFSLESRWWVGAESGVIEPS